MNKSLFIFCIALFTGINVFAQSHGVKIYNFHNTEQLKEFEKLNLDESHENLLNPNVSKDSINQVIASWTKLHQAIGTHLKSKDFSWGVESENISILHKIYFHNDGKIKAHFFRVLSPDLPEESANAFAKQLESFGKEYKLNINRANDFAQCGKARYTVSN